MATEAEFDVVVIGMGPGGEEVAGSLAEAGLRVLGVERELLGGECPYWGCVPSKMMVRAADLLAESGRIVGLAGTATAAGDWGLVAKRIREQATDNWNDQVAVDRFESKGGVFVRGAARIAGPGRVEVSGTTYLAARAIVVATGAAPVLPPIPGLDGVGAWTNRDVVRAQALPKSLLVLGGGAIGVEFAQAWHRFGVAVQVVEGGPRLLPLEEPEAATALAKVFADEGIGVHVGAQVEAARRDGARVILELGDGSELAAEQLLVATGRRPALAGLGLDTVGVSVVDGAVEVDDHMRAAPGVYAVGDCTGHGAFTHVAMYQAGIARAAILAPSGGDMGHGADYHALPRVTFTDPEIGSVGMTEAQARAAGLTVAVGSAAVASSARGWIHGPGSDGLIKLIEDRRRGGKVLGWRLQERPSLVS